MRDQVLLAEYRASEEVEPIRSEDAVELQPQAEEQV